MIIGVIKCDSIYQYICLRTTATGSCPTIQEFWYTLFDIITFSVLGFVFVFWHQLKNDKNAWYFYNCVYCTIKCISDRKEIQFCHSINKKLILCFNLYIWWLEKIIHGLASGSIFKSCISSTTHIKCWVLRKYSFPYGTSSLFLCIIMQGRW